MAILTIAKFNSIPAELRLNDKGRCFILRGGDLVPVLFVKPKGFYAPKQPKAA